MDVMSAPGRREEGGGRGPRGKPEAGGAAAWWEMRQAKSDSDGVRLSWRGSVDQREKG